MARFARGRWRSADGPAAPRAGRLKPSLVAGTRRGPQMPGALVVGKPQRLEGGCRGVAPNAGQWAEPKAAWRNRPGGNRDIGHSLLCDSIGRELRMLAQGITRAA